MVTARTSRFSDRIMLTVSRISCAVMKTTAAPLDAVHELEDVLVLHADLQPDALARDRQRAAQEESARPGQRVDGAMHAPDERRSEFLLNVAR